MRPRAYISTAQTTVVTAAGVTAIGLYIFPRELIVYAGHNYYAGLLLATLIACVPAFLLVRLATLFPGKTPFEYVQVVFGRPLGMIGGVWFALLYSSVAALTLRQYGDLVNTTFLPRTPIEVTMLLILSVVLYVNWHGFEAIVRFICFLYPGMLGLVAMVFLYSFTRATEFDALIPYTLPNLPRALEGAHAIAYGFLGMEAITMLLPFTRRPAHPYRLVGVAILINAGFLLLILVSTVAVFGVDPISELQYPGALVLRVLRLPGLIIERFGSFVALSWTALGLVFLCVRFWTIPSGIAQLWGLDLEQGRYFLFPMFFLTYFLALFPDNPNHLERLTRDFVTPAALITTTGVPILLLIVARIRRQGVWARR